MIPSILPILAFIGMASVQPGPTRTDRYGDPLPNGAVVRMGTARLRHRGLSDYLPLPDGKTVLTTGNDRVLRFWDLGTGRQVRAVRLQGTAGPGKGVTLSPDGKMLVAEDGQKLVFWEVDSGKELRTLPAPKVQRGYLYFSRDSKTLAVGRGDWRVSLWDLATGKEREIKLAFEPRPIVQFHMDSSFHGGFSPDGKWFVAGAAVNEPLGIFDAATGREVRRIQCRAYTSTVSPDSRRLAVSCAQDDKGVSRTIIRLFDLASGKELAQFPFDTKARFFALAFSPDGKLLACGSSDHSCLLDLTTGRVLCTLPDMPRDPAFTPDGKTLVAAVGRRLRCFDVATGKEHDDRPGEFGGNPVLAVSPDGRLLAAGDWVDRVVNLWDATDGRLLRRLPLKGEGRYVLNLAFSANGRTLIACQAMGFVQLWDAASGKEQRTSQLHDPNPAIQSGTFYDIHLSLDRMHVSALLDDQSFIRAGCGMHLGRWDAITGKLISQELLPEEPRSIVWSADGMAAILPLKDGLTLVDVSTGRVRLRYPGTAGISPITASPDGRLVAGRKLAKADAKRGPAAVVAWEAATGKEVAAVATGGVEHFALAPDNRTLVTTDAGFLRVWDLATGKERHRWPLPDAVIDGWGETAVLKLILAPDGRRAFTAMADGTCLAWDLTAAERPAEPLVKGAGAKELAAWWADLASADAGRAYAAIWRLAEAPQAVGFLRDRVRPVGDADLQGARQLIAELHSDTFSIRDKAYTQLEKLGDAATAAIRQAQAKDLPIEVRRRLEKLLAQPHALVDSPEAMCRLRAIEVLEQIGSPEARRLLAELAAGVPQAAQTQAASTALARLAHRPAER